MDKYFIGRENIQEFHKRVLRDKDKYAAPNNVNRLQLEENSVQKREIIRADAKDMAVCARNCFFQLSSPMVTTGESTCMFNCARLHHDARGYLLDKFSNLK